jgi:UDP-glucose 4-epimerase
VFVAVRDALGVSVEPRYAPKRPGEMTRIALDASRARGVLGWTPRVAFEQGIPPSVEFYRRRHAIK